MKTFFSLFVLALAFESIRSECCGTFTMEYSLKDNRDCTEIPGGRISHIGSLNCQVIVCYDGRWHEGSYCGKGPCNIFGCNCDGGCIRGNPSHPESPYDNFLDTYGDIVSNARLIGG